MVNRHAQDLVTRMTERRITLAVAESLTGGNLCGQIVDVPGASVMFRGGVVAYATDLKQRLLGVDTKLLAQGGPVQAKVALQMAKGVAKLCGADYGLATTGVAGPGNTEDGAAGLVYLAFTGPGIDCGGVTLKLSLAGSRKEVRAGAVKQSITFALKELRTANMVDLGENWSPY